VPALPPYIFEQFAALLAEREVDHPLGCHRPRIPERVGFEKLVQILVFGCAYWRIADESCSATTLRRRRDEWIEAGVMDTLQGLVLEAYDRIIGLELSEWLLTAASPRPSVAASGRAKARSYRCPGKPPRLATVG
jgi:transposase